MNKTPAREVAEMVYRKRYGNEELDEPLISLIADQLTAFAEERRSEAIEECAKVVDECVFRHAKGSALDAVGLAEYIAERIRALIPPQEGK